MTNGTRTAATKHVVIGSGPLGRATATALAEVGHQVALVNRSGSLVEPPTDVFMVAGDLGATARLSAKFFITAKWGRLGANHLAPDHSP